MEVADNDFIDKEQDMEIMVFTTDDTIIELPVESTAIDFAYSLGAEVGNHAKYARINGVLKQMATKLRDGDIVDIFTDPNSKPDSDWEWLVHTGKALAALNEYRDANPVSEYDFCDECNPISGEELIAIRSQYNSDWITVHKHDCEVARSLIADYGFETEDVSDFPSDTLFPVALIVRAVERKCLLPEIVDCIVRSHNLTIDSFNTSSNRNILVCRIGFGVHSLAELNAIVSHLSAIDGVDEVKRIPLDDDLLAYEL